MMAVLGVPFFSMGVILILDYFTGPTIALWLGLGIALILGSGIIVATIQRQR